MKRVKEAAAIAVVIIMQLSNIFVEANEALVTITGEVTAFGSNIDTLLAAKATVKIVTAKKEKELTFEDIQAVLAEKVRAGYTTEVGILLQKHGAERLSAVTQEEYAELMKEAKKIGHDN